MICEKKKKNGRRKRESFLNVGRILNAGGKKENRGCEKKSTMKRGREGATSVVRLGGKKSRKEEKRRTSLVHLRALKRRGSHPRLKEEGRQGFRREKRKRQIRGIRNTTVCSAGKGKIDKGRTIERGEKESVVGWERGDAAPCPSEEGEVEYGSKKKERGTACFRISSPLGKKIRRRSPRFSAAEGSL